MSELKITIDQLKNYLGTGFELYMDYDDESYVDILTGVIDDYYFTKEGEGDDYHIRGIRPYLYRLSDLDKFIPELGFVPIEELDDKLGVNQLWYRWGPLGRGEINIEKFEFRIVQKLFQWNFWVFDQSYFEAGLVIDKLKL